MMLEKGKKKKRFIYLNVEPFVIYFTIHEF